MVLKKSFFSDALQLNLNERDCLLIESKEHTIYYEGIDAGTRRADFVVELKALIRLEDVHLAQAKNYVTAYNYPIGLLINFESVSLEFKKIYNAE